MQKPVDVIEPLLLASTGKGDLVLDPFMGTGSTAIACIRMGRRFIGCELEEEHFADAVARIKAELARQPLFREEEAAERQGELL